MQQPAFEKCHGFGCRGLQDQVGTQPSQSLPGKSAPIRSAPAIAHTEWHLSDPAQGQQRPLAIVGSNGGAGLRSCLSVSQTLKILAKLCLMPSEAQRQTSGSSKNSLASRRGCGKPTPQSARRAIPEYANTAWESLDSELAAGLLTLLGLGTCMADCSNLPAGLCGDGDDGERRSLAKPSKIRKNIKNVTPFSPITHIRIFCSDSPGLCALQKLVATLLLPQLGPFPGPCPTASGPNPVATLNLGGPSSGHSLVSAFSSRRHRRLSAGQEHPGTLFRCERSDSRTVSALVTQPLQAKQSDKVTWPICACDRVTDFGARSHLQPGAARSAPRPGAPRAPRALGSEPLCFDLGQSEETAGATTLRT